MLNDKQISEGNMIPRGENDITFKRSDENKIFLYN